MLMISMSGWSESTVAGAELGGNSCAEVGASEVILHHKTTHHNTRDTSTKHHRPTLRDRSGVSSPSLSLPTPQSSHPPLPHPQLSLVAFSEKHRFTAVPNSLVTDLTQTDCGFVPNHTTRTILIPR